MQEAVRPKDVAAELDPITLEVIRHGLVSITNQIDANIKRTAFSPYIYEYNDFAVGLVGADGQLIAQCTGGMPPFVADSVGMAVRDGLQIYGKARMHHGDVVLCNHAAVQGQHLNNTVMYTPIYVGPDRSTLIGFFAINVHWIEIGGIQSNSTDIFMEGLQLRSIKLWSKGEPIEEVYRIIENNTRMPNELMGDIAAQLAGCLLGRDLTGQLAEKYGVAAFNAAVERILDQSEAAARAFIRAMPDGVYRCDTWLDNDRSGSDEPVPIKVKVIVDADELTVDFSEIAEQAKGSINSGYYGGGQTIARVAFKYLMGADEMANEGTFRPIKLVLPPGKLISADPTAPMFMYPTPFPTVIDAVIKALENALPGAGAGRAFRHTLRRAVLRPPRRRLVLRHPRLRTRRLGSLRDARRRRSVPDDGAWRHPHHSLGIAGVANAVPDRGVLAAGRFGRRRKIPRRARLPQALPHPAAVPPWHQSRPHQIPALGRARRQGGEAGPLHAYEGWLDRGAKRRKGERLSSRTRRPGLSGDRRWRRLWPAGGTFARPHPARP